MRAYQWNLVALRGDSAQVWDGVQELSRWSWVSKIRYSKCDDISATVTSNRLSFQFPINTVAITMQANLVTPARLMHAGFIASIVCFLSAFILEKISPESLVFWTWFGIFVVSSIVFYIGLGILVKRLGKNLLIWIGGAFITNPIGPIVAYLTMLSILKNRP